jgi:hypothetical protein
MRYPLLLCLGVEVIAWLIISINCLIEQYWLAFFGSAMMLAICMGVVCMAGDANDRGELE